MFFSKKIPFFSISFDLKTIAVQNINKTIEKNTVKNYIYVIRKVYKQTLYI